MNPVSIALMLLILQSGAVAGISNTLDLLSSAKLQDRMLATSQLKAAIVKNPLLLKESPVQEAIAKLLTTENHLVAENLQIVSKGGRGLFDEGFGEHYSEVLELAEAALRSVETDVPQFTELLYGLVTGTYNPDSEFAQRLAIEGEPIVPIVVQMSKNGNGPAKWNAFSLMAYMFQGTDQRALRAPLSEGSRQQLMDAARRGLQDPAPDVRTHAIRAVVAARDVTAVPLLRKMAQSDTDKRVGNNTYNVRDLAADAVRRLQPEH